MKKRRWSHSLLHAVLVIVGVVWIYPFLWTISASLKSNLSFYQTGINLIPSHVHWGNYVRAWSVAHFSRYFLNTVIITLGTVFIVVALSALTGYALGRVSFPGRRIVIGAVTALMFVPAGYTVIPIFQLINQLGLMNNLLGVIVAESSGAHVLFILLFAAFFAKIPQELDDSATIDGSGFARTFWSIMLPTAKPILATTIIMQFIWSWNSFLLPLVLTLNNPNLRTLAVGVFSFVGDHQTDWTGMAAAATIALVPVVVIFVAMQRYFIEGVAGSVKG